MFDKNLKVSVLQEMCKDTMIEHLGIEFTDVNSESITAKMPVDKRTVQPVGLLHGGASVTLAETLGSIASVSMVDNSKFDCVGLEINANHLRPARSGFVIGKVNAIHIGRKTHVWDVRISDMQGKLICISRLTVAIIEKSK